MKMNGRTPRLSTSVLKKVGQAWLTAFMLLSLPVAGFAQETTSAIRGNIFAPDGSPEANASVRVTDTRTGRSRVTTTNESGRFFVSDLDVGGPYEISVSAGNYTPQTVTDVTVGLGETFQFDLTLSSQTIEEIVVTAAALQTVQVAVGPSATFSFDDLQNLPAINRDIRDIVRVDPRVYVDEAFVDAVQCVGANPRFNSLTVDGIKLNDNFGLNATGFPTQRQPFPFDAIQNVAVELAPFDVQYGSFTACNTNAVTTSGTNEYSGRVWFDYTDQSLIGDELEGDKIDTDDFDEKRFGFSIGGPILRDKLFFFAAYEKLETADIFSRCAGDESCGTPVLGVTRAQLDRIATIAQDLYGYDPGGTLTTAPNEDEKYLLRLDWDINEQHRAALTYNYNDGFSVTGADRDADEFEFGNHFYERGAELEAWAGQLFSDWTDNFSTEIRVGFADVDPRVETLNNQGFGEVRIETYADIDGDGNFETADVFLGGDDSRQSNELEFDTLNLKFAGTYASGDHVTTVGFERETVNIFNLFVQHSIGEYRFDESRTDLLGNPVGCDPTRPSGCIDQFEAFSPDDIYYGNAGGTLDPNDAAADFGYSVNTLYAQDEFTFPDGRLTLVAGLRYDWYESNDLPNENGNFVSRTGFSNRNNLDGESLLQPRLGFNWAFSDTLSFRGGAGLYSGGNPNVWLGNVYQNDGFTQVQVREFDGGVQDLNIDPAQSLQTIPLGLDGNGRPIFDAPQTMINGVAGGTADSFVDALDPDFEIPKNWKFSLGSTWLFDAPGFLGDGYTLNADLIYSRADDSPIIFDDRLVNVGTAPDGRPIYFETDKSVPGCAEDPLADPGACGRSNSEYILTNVQGDDAESLSLSFALSKTHDWGLDWTFGYAYTESDDVSPMTSSTSGSNYFNLAVSDPNDPGRSTSNYEIPHRFILRLSYQREFFGDNVTRFTLFGASNEGRPFSYTFSDQEMFVLGPFDPDDDRSLLYMPDGPNDPLVTFGPDFDQTAFFDFAARRGIDKYAGRIVPRNAFNSDWWTKFDLRISQEIPGFGSDHKATAFLIVDNLTNLLNDDWGVLKERSFPRTAAIVEASLVDVNGTPDDFSDDVYSFDEFFTQGLSRSSSASLWSIRVGFNYNF